MTKTRTTENNITVWDWYTRLETKRILLPSWQRGLVWDKKQIENWESDLDYMVKKVKEGKESFIPGVLLFCRVGENNPLYINDGGNRTLATHAYVKKLLEQNIDDNSVMVIFSSIYVTYQEWLYDDENDAFIDFIRANQGALGTAKEMAQGILTTELPSYNTLWKNVLRDVHSYINESLSRMNCKLKLSRVQRHKGIRDNYSMLIRFLSKEKKQCDYKSGAKSLNIKLDGNKLVTNDTIEQKLVEELKNISADYEKYISNFKKMLDEEIALYQSLWNDIIPEKEKKAPCHSHLRWVIHLAIWRRNNNIPVDCYKNFLKALIKRTEGRTTVYPPVDSEKSHGTLGLSNLGSIGQVSRLIECDDILSITQRKKRIKNASPGYDESHVKAFADAGNGDTFLEPAVLNKSRGRKSLE